MGGQRLAAPSQPRAPVTLLDFSDKVSLTSLPRCLDERLPIFELAPSLGFSLVPLVLALLLHLESRLVEAAADVASLHCMDCVGMLHANERAKSFVLIKCCHPLQSVLPLRHLLSRVCQNLRAQMLALLLLSTLLPRLERLRDNRSTVA